jgi:ketosteroid isomerase-like protein
MSNTETVQKMFEAYLAGDSETATSLLAGDYTFTSPQDDRIDKRAFMERCFPTAGRVEWQRILELADAGENGVFMMYEYQLKEGGRHRNAEFTIVRDGQLRETHVFFGGDYEHHGAG